MAVQIFFPVTPKERDALVRGGAQYTELYGLDRIAWDTPGIYEDAEWVATVVAHAVAERHEDPDGKYLGYRSFTFPRELLNSLSWRVVGAQEIADARRTEQETANPLRPSTAGSSPASAVRAPAGG